MNDEENLHIVDTTNVLTYEELKELKQLASLSRSAKIFFALAIAIASLFGIDKVVNLLTRH